MAGRFLLVAAVLAGCGGDEPLEGPLKTCILSVEFPAGGCSLCGVAVLDGEVVDTENFTVLKSDRKAGYDDYDDWASQTCSTFWPAGDGAVGTMLKADGCEELGYTDKALFEFWTGEIEEYNHDGSCTTFVDTTGGPTTGG